MVSEKTKGELYIFTEVLLWAFFPIVTTLSYSTIPALASLFWSTLIAAIFFAGIMAVRSRFIELKNLLLWKYSIGITILIGVMYYALYFIGLQHTTAGNAALLAQFEVFTSFIFFHVFRREYVSRGYIVGGLLMVLGVVIVLLPNVSRINIGDFLILGAVVFTPPANLLQQKARAIASSESILFVRSVGASVCIFLLMYILGIQTVGNSLRPAFPFLIMNGALLLGLSKIFWIEGIHRISVSKSIAFGTAGPALTLLLAWPILHQVPTVWQLTSLLPFTAGILLLTDQISFKTRMLA